MKNEPQIGLKKPENFEKNLEIFFMIRAEMSFVAFLRLFGAFYISLS
tara:strand:+ start:161 stop:301 length:141 start_codon:yes stop_codon:yes gene_type:complete